MPMAMMEAVKEVRNKLSLIALTDSFTFSMKFIGRMGLSVPKRSFQQKT
jgi:hypothetical protein